MSASLPPRHVDEAPQDAARSFSLSSAPPIGTIQPRVAPSGLLLGSPVCAPQACVSNVPRTTVPRRHGRGRRPNHDGHARRLSRPMQPGRHRRRTAIVPLPSRRSSRAGLRRERRQCGLERHAAREQVTQRREQGAGAADVHVTDAPVGVEARQAAAAIRADRDALRRGACREVSRSPSAAGVRVFAVGDRERRDVDDAARARQLDRLVEQRLARLTWVGLKTRAGSLADARARGARGRARARRRRGAGAGCRPCRS